MLMCMATVYSAYIRRFNHSLFIFQQRQNIFPLLLLYFLDDFLFSGANHVFFFLQ